MVEKWLILSGSYGNGHNAARDALTEVLQAEGCQVKTADMVEMYRHRGAAGTQMFFELSQKIPLLWGKTFELLDTRIANATLNLMIKGFPHGDFDRLIEDFQPDFVVATFPHWPVFLKNFVRRKGKSFKTGVVVTDAGNVAMPWYYGSQSIDKFYTINQDTAQFLSKKVRGKIPVETTFFPLADRFFYDKEGTPSGTVALLLTGVPTYFAKSFIQTIEQAPEIKKLIVLQGREPHLWKKLQRLASQKIQFHAWWDIKANLKDVDIFIGKPGGALMCECIAQDVPVIIPAFVPGQEQGNVDLMERAGVGMYEADPLRAAVLARFLDVRKMLPNFQALKKRGSARAIIESLRSTK